jgi:hypothetical protein
MYSIGDFFKDVFCFIRHIPDALLFIFAYAIGVRPYKVMAMHKNSPCSEAEHYCNTLLPPTIKADSWEGREWALSHMDELETTLFKFYWFNELQPMPFFAYLWNDVLMPFEF